MAVPLRRLDNLMIRTLSVRALLVGGIVAAACGGGDSGEVFRFDDQPTAVQIETAVGDVTVSPNTRSGTEVTAVTAGDTEPVVSVVLADGTLRISDDCQRDCSVDYQVLVGDTADIELVAGRGNVAVSGIEGAITVTVAEGNVSFNDITASILDVETTTGDIIGARMRAPTATFETTDGAIDVTFDQPVDELTVVAGSGDVTAQLPGGPYAVDISAPGDVDVLVDDDPASTRRVVLRTGSGDATVYRR